MKQRVVRSVDEERVVVYRSQDHGVRELMLVEAIGQGERMVAGEDAKLRNPWVGM